MPRARFGFRISGFFRISDFGFRICRPGAVGLLLSHSLSLCLLLAVSTAPLISAEPGLKVTGEWEVQVTAPGALAATNLGIAPPALIAVTGERYDSLPVFNPNTGGWVKGAQLRAVRAQETTTPFLLDPTSLVLRAGPEPGSPVFELGKDYAADPVWGTFGRLASGTIQSTQAVYASYRYSPLRLDAIVQTSSGQLLARQGTPRAAAPAPPAIQPGERHLANIWLPGRVAKLGPEHLFPILEAAYPESAKPKPAPAEQFLPKTMAKLSSGQSLRVLAWGDSVTDGSYLAIQERWQEQFVTRLRARFPQARIELITEAWGGRNTSSYLAEPPGSPHNYREKVLDAKPDLIVSEFVNDAGFNPEQVEARYGKLLADFQQIGAEWSSSRLTTSARIGWAWTASAISITIRVPTLPAFASLPRATPSRSPTLPSVMAGSGGKGCLTAP